MLEAFHRPTPKEPAGRTALVAGAVGRLGEAVLNQVLASDNYSQVFVLGEGVLSSTMRGLRLGSLETLPSIDSVYLVISDVENKNHRSFYGRDLRFTVLTPDNLVYLAQAAAAKGARKALLVAPAPAWQQMSRFQQGLMNPSESALAAMSFEALVVLRPVAQSKSSVGGLLQKFASFYLDLQMMMMPRSIPVLTSDQLGRASVLAMLEAKGGVSVLQPEQIAQLLD
jgi:hypothetical protein